MFSFRVHIRGPMLGYDSGFHLVFQVASDAVDHARLKNFDRNLNISPKHPPENLRSKRQAKNVMRTAGQKWCAIGTPQPRVSTTQVKH